MFNVLHKKICHIILINSLINFNLLLINGNTNLKNVKGFNEICGLNNGKKIYIESGEHGKLRGTNITLNSKFCNGQPINASNIECECGIEIITCPSCVITLYITLEIKNTSCQSDYLWLGEPPYDAEIYGKRICGNEVLQYRSETRSLSIKFFFQNNHSAAFNLDYTAERNIIKINEELNGTQFKSTTIASPYFPMFYPRDYGIEYVINCLNENCRIRIIFSDYQISPASTLEIYDKIENGIKTNEYSGKIFRPPIIFSQGTSIIIRFYANGGTGFGFKAMINFIPKDNVIVPQLNPSTDCGGFVETLGGAITMMNMISASKQLNDTIIKYFDCYWIIKPPTNFIHLKTHLLIRIETFENMLNPSELVIQQGLTSDHGDLVTLTATSLMNPINSKTFIIPLSSGFYVSLKGSFGVDSKLAIVYAAFSNMDCYIGSEFLCQNHRCIPMQLHCDGFDHCGDSSDEPATCVIKGENETINRKWYSRTPNYYFPKSEQYPDWKVATIVFMISCLGLVILITTLIVLLYRMGARARHQRDIQNHLQTISELLDSNRDENTHVDDPPLYEAPPDYDDVIKVGMDKQMNHRKRSKRSSHKYTKDRNRLRRSNKYPKNISNDIIQANNISIKNNEFSESEDIIEFFPSARQAETTAPYSFAETSQQAKNFESKYCEETNSQPFIENITKRRKLYDIRTSSEGYTNVLTSIPNTSSSASSVNNIVLNINKNKIICKHCLSYFSMTTSAEFDNQSNDKFDYEGCPACEPFLTPKNIALHENVSINSSTINSRNKIIKNSSFELLIDDNNTDLNYTPIRKSVNEILSNLE